ncbi:MAG: hypothetical protein Q7U14_06440, partial [Lacisediminimonas sp.]|nr:hypothetical protein [Lacisediminimonas sp.]
MLASVPEVAEHAAQGVIASLYQDIRLVTGAELVNLVYRHLATDPAVLAWAWATLRPHFISGLLPAQAAALRTGVETRNRASLADTGPALPSCATLALPVIRTYCHTNCLNMIALTHLLGGQPPAGAASPAPALAASEKLPALPPLPGWDALSAHTLAIVQRLNQMAETSPPTVIASLYRHLACWPALLPAVEGLLLPLERSQSLLAARIATAQSAAQLAHAQPLVLAPPPAV